MKFAGKRHGALRRELSAAGVVVILCSLASIGYAADLKPGPIAGKTVRLDKARGYPFCEFEVVMGQPPSLGVQVYSTAGQSPCLPGQIDPVDAKALAEKLNVDAVVKIPTHYLLMDSLWLYGVGETRDFDGTKATWMAKLQMEKGAIEQHKKDPSVAYQPSVAARNLKFVWKKGSQVYLLRDPGGKVWIMQAYSALIDKSLTAADLPKLGSRLKLPPGWKYEVKKLDRELAFAPPASTGYLTHAIADDLENIYRGCGFDTACNYTP